MLRGRARAPADQNEFSFTVFFLNDKTSYFKLNLVRGLVSTRLIRNGMYLFLFTGKGGGANKWGSLLEAVYQVKHFSEPRGSKFPFATLIESRRELGQKCVQQLFLGSLLRMRRSAHDAPYSRPQKFCIRIALAVIPRRNDKQTYARFWGANKVHYAKCGSGILTNFFPCSQQQSHAEVFAKNKLSPVPLTCSTAEFDEITAFCHPTSLVPVSRKSR